MIKEKHLIELGFIKNQVTAEQSGANAFYYYTFQPSEDSNLCLISQANDEVKEGWVISFFDEDLHVKDPDDLTQLIQVLKKIANE